MREPGQKRRPPQDQGFVTQRAASMKGVGVHKTNCSPVQRIKICGQSQAGWSTSGGQHGTTSVKVFPCSSIRDRPSTPGKGRSLSCVYTKHLILLHFKLGVPRALRPRRLCLSRLFGAHKFGTPSTKHVLASEGRTDAAFVAVFAMHILYRVIPSFKSPFRTSGTSVKPRT